MKFSREQKIILLSALAGAMFAFRVVLFIEHLEELASAVEAKPEEKQPSWLRSRYRPAVKKEEASA